MESAASRRKLQDAGIRRERKRRESHGIPQHPCRPGPHQSDGKRGQPDIFGSSQPLVSQQQHQRQGETVSLEPGADRVKRRRQGDTSPRSLSLFGCSRPPGSPSARLDEAPGWTATHLLYTCARDAVTEKATRPGRPPALARHPATGGWLFVASSTLHFRRSQ